MKPGKPFIPTPAGNMNSRKPKVRIVKIEMLDEQGESFSPPVFQYWVCTLENPPEVLKCANTLKEALDFVAANEYSLTP